MPTGRALWHFHFATCYFSASHRRLRPALTHRAQLNYMRAAESTKKSFHNIPVPWSLGKFDQDRPKMISAPAHTHPTPRSKVPAPPLGLSSSHHRVFGADVELRPTPSTLERVGYVMSRTSSYGTGTIALASHRSPHEDIEL